MYTVLPPNPFSELSAIEDTRALHPERCSGRTRGTLVAKGADWNKRGRRTAKGGGGGGKNKATDISTRPKVCFEVIDYIIDQNSAVRGSSRPWVDRVDQETVN